jgi:hypothetical protein
MAIDRALAAGNLEGWRLSGVGSVEPGGRRLLLPASGAALEMIPRGTQTAYAELLRSCDAGLALMYTPHPSLVPLEMAAAGMATVTNSFESKDRASLQALSANLIVAEPTVDGIAAALGEAERRSGDIAARAEGSRLEWPSSWDEALGDAVMERVEALLEQR